MKKILFIIIAFAAFAMSSYAQVTITTNTRCYLLKNDINLETWGNKLLKDVKQSIIPKGKELEVIGIDTIAYKLYHVKYKKKIGWIHKDVILDDSYIVNADPMIRDEFRDIILENSVAIGMNEHEVEQSLGYPIEINRTITANGEKKQMIYGKVFTYYSFVGTQVYTNRITSDKVYIYTENGIVTAIQDQPKP